MVDQKIIQTHSVATDVRILAAHPGIEVYGHGSDFQPPHGLDKLLVYLALLVSSEERVMTHTYRGWMRFTIEPVQCLYDLQECRE